MKKDFKTRAELCGDLYGKYMETGKLPDGSKVVLTRKEFDNRLLNGKDYISKKKLAKMLEGGIKENGKQKTNPQKGNKRPKINKDKAKRCG